MGLTDLLVCGLLRQGALGLSGWAMKPTLLVNLLPGFFEYAPLAAQFARLRERFVVRTASCNTQEEIRPHLKGVDAVLMWSWPVLTEELLDENPQLRISANLDVAQRGAKLLLERGTPVSCAKRAFSPAVAEMALTLILATLRRTSTFHSQMWRGEEPWVNAFPEEIDIHERQLTGRSVGIIGFGGIGQRLAELLAPFHCRVRAYDPFLPPEVASKFGAELTSLDALFEQSEIVVCCAAANEGSSHLVTKAHIEKLAPHSVFVNVSRAALIDYGALLARLERGDLFAALDVFEKEPLALDSAFRKLPNAYLTPHRAGGITESVQRLFSMLVDDLEAHFDGKPIKHAVTERMIPSLDV